jgi:glutaredoxin 3
VFDVTEYDCNVLEELTKERCMSVKIYVKDYCPFCIQVESYLKRNEIAFEKVEVSDSPKEYQELKQRTGHQTVPQVFIDNEFIGGAQEFMSFVRSNDL